LYQWSDPYELKQNYSDRNTAIALAYQRGGIVWSDPIIFIVNLTTLFP